MKHPHAVFDIKRQRKIQKAFKLGFCLEDLKKAIDGCSLTPYNMGKNDSKQVYDGIDLIFRDAEHIERFIKNADSSDMGDEANSTDHFMAGVI